MIFYFLFLCSILFSNQKENAERPFMIVSGVAQDAGYPQIDCKKDCCKKYWDKKIPHQKVVSLTLFDPANNRKWIFEATPDIAEQLHESNNYLNAELAGVFLTHAHIGHYTGLMYLGKEAMSAKEIPVYAMPRMNNFLQNNGPWNQLVLQKNILLQKLKADSSIRLSENISVTPFQVPHRDEYSETVGYSISIYKKKLLFIPDIDKWEKWDRDIRQMVKMYDYLFLDATFFDEKELPGRSMSEIPHPFVKESMETFHDLRQEEKSRIWFIHFNHTNPLIDPSTKEYKEVRNRGFNVAIEGYKILF